MSPQFISIIIPCRNEGVFISKCLDSILEQDFPKDQLEILVADGMSTDKTREILQAYAEKYAFIRWFDNPLKIVPTGLNILIRQSLGQIIVRMDSHADYPRDYIAQCVYYLNERDVDNVGGLCETLPGSESFMGISVALALSSGFGVGNSLFRTGGIKEPQLVDTVPFGCFRREIFDKIGMFDEDLVRNQDDEFNSRIIKNGGKILLVPQIVSKYYARSSFGKLWRMYYQYGYFKPLTVLKLGGVMTWRQLIPSIFVVSLFLFGLFSFVFPVLKCMFLVECFLYLLANFTFSFLLALKNDLFLTPFLIVSFIIIHFGYGFGYLKGIFDFIVLKKHLHNKLKDVAMSR